MRNPPELADVPPAPDLPGSVIVRPDRDALIDAVCADLYLHAQDCVRAFGDFHLAVDASDVPLGALMRLMVDPLYRGLPWAETHAWVIADGPHPPDDERSAYARLAGLVGEHAGMPAGQLHAVPIGSPKPDEQYEADLRRCLGWREPGHDRLDFALLDGRSGPVEGPVAGDEGQLVAHEGERVGMTARVLSGARFVAVVCAGGDAGASAGDPASRLRGVAPVGGERRWYLDHDACAGAAQGSVTDPDTGDAEA